MDRLTAYLFLPLFSILCLIYVYCKRCYSYWEKRGVHALSKPALIFGHSKPFLKRESAARDIFKEIYDECRQKSQKISGFYFFTKPCLVICDLDLVKRIMKTDFEHFTDRLFHNHESDPLSEHMGSLKGEKWKKCRLKLSPAFTSAKTSMMFPTIVKYIDEFVDILKKSSFEHAEVEIRDLVDRFSIDVIGSCAFGIECNSLKNPNSDFGYYARNFFSTSLKDSLVMLLTCLCPSALSLVRVRSIRKDIGDFFLKVVGENIKFREDNNVIRKDFLHLLLQVRNNVAINENAVGIIKDNADSTPLLTETNVTAHSIVFFMAGYDTSASTIAFCLYELSLDLDIQAKARREVVQILDEHNQEFCYEVVNKMGYIEKCVKETLRKYAPPPAHLRECTTSYNLPDTNLLIEKGTPVFVPVHGIHMDPEIYPDPEKFDPERFTDECIAARHPCAWIPFGFGPRMCIGMKFGMTETKSCIAKLLLNFEFRTNGLTEIPIKIDPKSVVTNCENGIWLTIKTLD
ncbi:hypothetical protein PPYR_04526 [Photinus pyralis]|uniref:Cytochrome P450 n=1 Tax=Photinus pyralis TaxID=7054 RepID=A0A1Y1M1C1_PHOPY|nr:probable cytochrome P450 6a23 [Photinus pyralis]KAB0802340.1 hypothetical protein PPYR_04526 [Photinus pyralis]